MVDIYEEILRMKNAGQVGALATIVSAQGSTPREVGAKMLIRSDGSILGTIGGGALENAVRQEAQKAIQEEKPRTLHYDLTGKEAAGLGMICGGKVDVYIEPIVPKPEVFIFGAGHISLHLAKLSATVGFQVTVIDDRTEFANKDRFPDAQAVIAEAFPLAQSRLQPNRSSYIVIVTRGHQFDQEVLEWALGTEAKYIGMIGSRRKIQTVFENLQKKGVSPKKLEHVHAPIGLDIGALTPEEIAVSIVAEMIQVRRGKKYSP